MDWLVALVGYILPDQIFLLSGVSLFLMRVDEDSQAQSRTHSRVMLTIKDVWIF